MVASKEPWPKYGIDQYSKIQDGPWGYLILKGDGEFMFDGSIHPSEKEIMVGGHTPLTEQNNNNGLAL